MTIRKFIIYSAWDKTLSKKVVSYILYTVIQILFLSGSISVFGQYTYSFDARCRQANDALIDLRLDEAERLIVVEKQLHPDNNIPYLLESYMLFFKVFISEDETLFEKYDKRHEKIYDRLDQGDENSPYYLYCKAVVNSHWALARLKFSEFLKAAFEFRKAHKQLEENERRFPRFLLDNLYSGIFHIAVGSVPTEYMWLVHLLGFEGTIKQGTQEIQDLTEAMKVDSSLRIFQREVIFYKVFLDMNVTNDMQSSYQLYEKSLQTNDTALLKSPLMAYAFARLLKEMKKNDEAIQLLENRHREKQYYPFYYLDYVLGYYKLQRLDTSANIDILKFTVNFKGKIYLKSAYQKLSWYYLISGDTSRFEQEQSKILLFGNTLSDDDKQAEFEAKDKQIPNVYLLRSRLLSDGGYFAKAQAILLEKKTTILDKSNTKDKIEFYYRLGRINHEWGKMEKAIPYYKKTIEQGSHLSYYYAANSALKLGNIYEVKEDSKNALYYYRLATQMDNEEYKSSIDQKAKAGIQRIEEKE